MKIMIHVMTALKQVLQMLLTMVMIMTLVGIQVMVKHFVMQVTVMMITIIH